MTAGKEERGEERIEENTEKKDHVQISALDEMIKEGIEVPEARNDHIFSFRQLLAYVGPGFLMSIAYLDPGNINADLTAGVAAGYGLLWVLLLAHVLGLFLQRISARLGVVSGRHLAEVAHEYYPIVPRYIIWIMIEIAIIGADMQEVIGTAVAFTLLSSGKMPLWAGVLITIVDTLTFLFMEKFGFRKLEIFFCTLIAIMAFTFGTEYVMLTPNQGSVMYGIFVPQCPNCNTNVFMQAVGIVGAVIQPHNLYLHSALVKTRRVNRKSYKSVSTANKYFFIESAIALLCSFIINLFVLSVFGTGLYNKTNNETRQICLDHHEYEYADKFTNQTDVLTSDDLDIYKGGLWLGCMFGAAGLYIWAIGLLAAGQSSTMAGCYAGQFVMEGFLNIRWARWKRVLFTRSVAIVPTLLIAVFQDIQHLTGMNNLLNVMQMIQLPFALLPCLTFTCSEKVMKNFKNGIFFRIFLSIVVVIAIIINLITVFEYIQSIAGDSLPAWIGTAIVAVIYFAFVLYLATYCVAAIFLKEDKLTCPGIRRIFRMNPNMHIDAPWLDKDDPNDMLKRGQSAISIVSNNDSSCSNRSPDDFDQMQCRNRIQPLIPGFVSEDDDFCKL